MTQSFFIPIKPASWNRIATAHWRVYKQYKDLLAQATWIACKGAKIKPLKGSVDISVCAYWKDKRIRDVDNIFVKSVLDQLVNEQIIEKDDCFTVKSVSYCGLVGQAKEGLLVTIRTHE